MLRALLFLLLFLPTVLPALAQPRVVKIAVDDAHPPYTYVLNGQAAGLYVQLLGLAMRDMPGNWQLQFVARPWVRALNESEQGLVDGFLPPYRHAEREWVASFAGPLHAEEVVLSCRKALGLSTSAVWPEDFVNRRIGITRGYLLSKELSAAFRQQLMPQRDYRNARDALAALAAGEIDCYANDLLDIEHAHRNALADKVWVRRVPAQLEPPVVMSRQLAFVGFSRASLAQRPELAEFIQALNGQIAQLRANGEIQRMLGTRQMALK